MRSRTITQPQPGNNILYRPVLYYCLLAIITFIAVFPSLKNDFVNIDDDTYVINNPDIKGVTFHNLGKIFSSKYVDNYQPITMLTYDDFKKACNLGFELACKQLNEN